MSKSKFIFISSMFFLLTFTLKAENNNQGDSTNGDIIILFPKTEPIRPNSLTSSYIVCKYNQGYITIDFPIEVESITVTIYQRNLIVWQGYMTIETPSSSIHTSLQGEYDVECTTDMDQVYIGTITF